MAYCTVYWCLIPALWLQFLATDNRISFRGYHNLFTSVSRQYCRYLWEDYAVIGETSLNFYQSWIETMKLWKVTFHNSTAFISDSPVQLGEDIYLGFGIKVSFIMTAGKSPDGSQIRFNSCLRPEVVFQIEKKILTSIIISVISEVSVCLFSALIILGAVAVGFNRCMNSCDYGAS